MMLLGGHCYIFQVAMSCIGITRPDISTHQDRVVKLVEMPMTAEMDLVVALLDLSSGIENVWTTRIILQAVEVYVS